MIERTTAVHLALRRACVAGALVLAITVLLGTLFPRTMGPLPDGMRTPVVAFELARSAEEVERMFGQQGSAERAAWAAAMDRGNLADFAFMVLYGAYLLLFSQALVKLGARARWMVLLAPLPPLVDVLENLQLLRITDRLGGDYALPLSRLAWFTWGKWLSLALILTLWIQPLWRLGALARTAALCAGLTGMLSLLALFVRGLAAELMAAGCAVTMIVTWVTALGLLRRSASARVDDSP